MANQTTLAEIQAKVKANKTQFNSFGKYYYRSAEDILEAVKQVINPLGFYIILNDDIVERGGRIYVQSTATLSNGSVSYSASAFAREEESKKGMDSSQLTGATSSYSRKYALNGLFALDDNKDSDATNMHGKEEQKQSLNANSWVNAINGCKTNEELMALYNANKDKITTEVKELFTKRKLELQ